MSRQQPFIRPEELQSQNSTKKGKSKKKKWGQEYLSFIWIEIEEKISSNKMNWRWNKINERNVERKGRGGNIEWERLSILTFTWTFVAVLVCGYARVYLFSVSVNSDYDQFTKVWLQMHWPQTLSHKHTLQINGQFSHNSAVQTSHSPETRWKTMLPLGLPLNSIQCVYSPAGLTVSCLWDQIWSIVDFWTSEHVHPVSYY